MPNIPTLRPPSPLELAQEKQRNYAAAPRITGSNRPRIPLPQWLVDAVDSGLDTFGQQPLARMVRGLTDIGLNPADPANIGAPTAQAIGIVATQTPKIARWSKEFPVGSIIEKTGQWGEVPKEALEWFARRFPRFAQQARFEMDPTLPKRVSGRLTADTHLPWRSAHILGGGGRNPSRVASIKLNPSVHNMRFGGSAVGDTVDTLAHEAQHLGDNLRGPETFDAAYDLMNVHPFSYEKNPFENLANISGARTKAEWMRSAGKNPNDIGELLENASRGQRISFPDIVQEILTGRIPPQSHGPEAVLQALRRPNRALASEASRIVRVNPYDTVRAQEQFAKMFSQPDQLRRAIILGR